MNYLNYSRDVKKIMNKEGEEIKKMENIIETMRGVEIVLSTQIDFNGEFLSVPYVEKMKEVIS